MSAAVKDYVPQPGTIAAKFIDHLRSLPVGTKVPTQVMLDAIGQSDNSNIRMYMNPAIKAGLVQCARSNGERSLRWFLVAEQQPSDHGQAPAGSQKSEPGVDDLSDLAGPPPSPDLTTSSVFALAHARSLDPAPVQAAAEEPAVVTALPGGRKAWPFKSEPAADPQPTVAAEASPGEFRCALFSDGQLLIKTGSQEATLPVEHTRQLMHYLDRISFDEYSAGVGPQ